MDRRGHCDPLLVRDIIILIYNPRHRVLLQGVLLLNELRLKAWTIDTWIPMRKDNIKESFNTKVVNSTEQAHWRVRVSALCYWILTTMYSALDSSDQFRPARIIVFVSKETKIDKATDFIIHWICNTEQTAWYSPTQATMICAGKATGQVFYTDRWSMLQGNSIKRSQYRITALVRKHKGLEGGCLWNIPCISDCH
jgi:hypothetical protein